MAKILLVEDSAVYRGIERDYLESASHVVDTANSGDEALEIMRATNTKEKRYDLVVTDIVMPGMHGDKLLDVARQELTAYRDVPFIVATSAELSLDDVAAMGFDAYVNKGEAYNLAFVVNNLVRAKSAQEIL